MNSPSLPAQAADCLEQNSLGSGQLVTSNGMATAKPSSRKGSRTDFWRKPRYSEISVSSLSPVQLGSTEDLRMWLRRGSLASHSALPESNSPPMTSGTCGPQRGMLFAWLDRASHSWKTCQGCLALDTFPLSFLILPRSGSMRNGECFLLPEAERPIYENESGFWLTPTRVERFCKDETEMVQTKNGTVRRKYKNGKTSSLGLTQQVRMRMWPTPSATDGKGSPRGGVLEARMEHSRGVRLTEEVMRRFLPTPGCPRPHDSENTVGKFMPNQRQQDLASAVARDGGQLNPDWVEWLMGWPIGWTDLKPLETGKSPIPSSAHGKNSVKESRESALKNSEPVNSDGARNK